MSAVLDITETIIAKTVIEAIAIAPLKATAVAVTVTNKSLKKGVGGAV